jgi:hypothetical protein
VEGTDRTNTLARAEDTTRDFLVVLLRRHFTGPDDYHHAFLTGCEVLRPAVQAGDLDGATASRIVGDALNVLQGERVLADAEQQSIIRALRRNPRAKVLRTGRAWCVIRSSAPARHISPQPRARGRVRRRAGARTRSGTDPPDGGEPEPPQLRLVVPPPRRGARFAFGCLTAEERS